MMQFNNLKSSALKFLVQGESRRPS